MTENEHPSPEMDEAPAHPLPPSSPTLSDITGQLRAWGTHKLATTKNEATEKLTTAKAKATETITTAKQKATEAAPANLQDAYAKAQPWMQKAATRTAAWSRTAWAATVKWWQDINTMKTAPQSSPHDDEIRAWIETDPDRLTDEQREAHAAHLMELTARAGPGRIEKILAEYRPVERSEAASVRTSTIAPDDSYTKVITLSVPPSTKWLPDIAQQLMINLFDTSAPFLTFFLHAAPHRIQWGIEVPAPFLDPVQNALYSLYPQATVTVSPKTTTAIGFARFDYHAGNSFVAPITAADDFSKTDPIAGIASALSTLTEGEEVIYSLTLTRPSFNYEKYGEKIITRSRIGVLNFVLPVAMIHAAAMASTGSTRADKYASDIQKTIRSKVHAPLKEVDLTLKVNASPERTQTIVGSFTPALAPFYLEGFNFPTPATKTTHPMLLTAQETAALWHLPTELCQTPGIVWGSGAVAPLPTVLIGRTEGVLLGENHYQGRTHAVHLPYPDRVTHVNLIGKTRTGKSTLLHRMAHQDIANGMGLAVIDPHGDLIDAILAASIPPHRTDDVVIFDTRDHEYAIGLNLLTAPPDVSLDAVASQTLAVIRKMFADQWSATRMESVLDAAIRSLVPYPGATIQDIPRLLLDQPFRRDVLSHVTDPTTLEFWYQEYEVETERNQREFARPINHRLRKFYRDPALRAIVCQVASLDFRALLNTNKIFLASLAGIADIDAETLGALLISKLQLAAMSRATLPPAQRTPFYLYIDEVQNFITTSLPKLFSEAGKYGMSLVVANQFLKQLEGDTLEAILGNVGATIIFRVGPNDTRALTPFVKEQFSAEDLTNLDRFNTVVKMQLAGQTLPAFSMLSVPPLPIADDAAEYSHHLREQSRTTYARPVAEVEQELTARFQLEAPARPQRTEKPTDEGWLDDLAE